MPGPGRYPLVCPAITEQLCPDFVGVTPGIRPALCPVSYAPVEFFFVHGLAIHVVPLMTTRLYGRELIVVQHYVM